MPDIGDDATEARTLKLTRIVPVAVITPENHDGQVLIVLIRVF